MKNFVQPGVSLTLIAPGAGVVSGRAVKIGSIIAVASSTVAAGLTFEGMTHGVFDHAAEAAAWAAGDILYWDAANNNFTKTAGALQKAGVAVEAKLVNVLIGRVKLMPTI